MEERGRVIGNSSRLFRRTILCTAMLAAAAGCGVSAANSTRLPSTAASNPTALVFKHCPELVCTQADVPRCDFSEIVDSDGLNPIRERFGCVRSGHGTVCEEHRALVGSEDTPLENQVLKFQCSGDPVECEAIGGISPWARTLELPKTSRKSVSCRAPHPAGPPPAPNPVPGPDTV